MKDNRCCGSGVCIINADGICWCGQKWDGAKLLNPKYTENDPNTLTNIKTPVKTNNSTD